MPNVSQPDISPPTGVASRELWFDYIVKLNDRLNQGAQLSGATNWVLGAVLGTLVFKSVPELAVLSSFPRLRVEALVLGLLALNAVIWGAVALYLLLFQLGTDLGHRLLPERSRQVEPFMFWTTMGVGATLVVLQFVTLRSAASTTARRISFFLGLWLGSNLFLALWKRIKRIRTERTFKIPLPHFQAMPVPQEYGWLGALLHLPLVAASLYGWWAEFRALVGLSPDRWASVSRLSLYVVASLLVAGYLFFRATAGRQAAWLRQLEGDIVTENLDPSEIRSRFLSYSLGPTIGDWLTDLARREEKIQHENQLFLENTDRAATAIESLDPGYHYERAGRACKLLEEVRTQVKEHLTRLKAINAELQQLREARVPRGQHDQIEKVLDVWEGRGETMDKQADLVVDLMSRLEKLAGGSQPGMPTAAK